MNRLGIIRTVGALALSATATAAIAQDKTPAFSEAPELAAARCTAAPATPRDMRLSGYDTVRETENVTFSPQQLADINGKLGTGYTQGYYKCSEFDRLSRDPKSFVQGGTYLLDEWNAAVADGTLKVVGVDRRITVTLGSPPISENGGFAEERYMGVLKQFGSAVPVITYYGENSNSTPVEGQPGMVFTLRPDRYVNSHTNYDGFEGNKRSVAIRDSVSGMIVAPWPLDNLAPRPRDAQLAQSFLDAAKPHISELKK